METERTTMTFDREDEQLSTTLVRPVSGSNHPALVLVPAVHGVNDYVLEVADRLAARGYVTSVLDIYSRGDAPKDLGGREQILAAVAALPDDRVAADVAAAGRHLLDMSDVTGVGALGFCVGGLFAYLASCKADHFSATVNFYGMIRYDELTDNKPVSPVELADNLQAPMLSHYGQLDPWCPPAHVDEFDDRLAAAGKTYELYRYPGAGHAFHEHHREVAYRPVAAKAAWESSMAFIDYYLKGVHS